MKQILCEKFGYNILLISKNSRYPVSIIGTRQLTAGKFQYAKPLLVVTRILIGALKPRYIILGGAIGGGVALKKKYEQWKNGLPDMAWIYGLIPNDQMWKDFRGSLMSAKNTISDKIEIDPRLKELGESKYKEYMLWFNQRLDDAIKAAEASKADAIEYYNNTNNNNSSNPAETTGDDKKKFNMWLGRWK